MKLYIVALWLGALTALLENGFCSVLFSGGPYCTDSNTIHAVPGTTISLTCTVDNPDGVTNLLTWTIPSFGVQVANLNGVNGVDTDQSEFTSTVNSANSIDATTNATLSFPAVSELDGAVVNCADLFSVTQNCTLYILTPPSPPSVSCTSNTSSSIMLVLTPPTDNGGESITHYAVTVTPGDNNITTTMTSLLVSDLTPLTEYTFTVRANNTVGYSNYSDTVICTTPGEVFDPIPANDIEVCLENIVATDLLISIDNCPPVNPNVATTPDFDNYTITITGYNPINVTDCQYQQPMITEGVYNITITINNIEGPSEPTTVSFVAHWIRDIVFDNEQQIISYSIPDCVIVAYVNVTIDITQASNTVFDGEQPYNSQYTSFVIPSNSLSPYSSYDYTLQVIGLTGTTPLYTESIPAISTTTVTPTVSGSVSPTTTTTATTDTTSPVTTTDASSSLIPAIAGAVGGVIILAPLIVIALIIGLMCYKKRFNNKSDKNAPIPLDNM